jgi:carboxymethylenebutenolidase
MNEFTFDLNTSDGDMTTFAAHPDGAGPFPAVILYMDAPGIREELRDFTRRIARQGYFCILPDMYYRFENPRFDLSLGDDEIKRMFSTMSALTSEMVLADTASMLEYFTGNELATDRVGIIGYCMSGRFVVSAAGHYPERIKAVASLYGVGIVTDQPDSPHLLADKIDAELYMGFAEHDTYVDDAVAPTLIKALDENKVTHFTETVPGTHHGFCFPGRGPIYVEEAAERVWDIVFDMYARTLKE